MDRCLRYCRSTVRFSGGPVPVHFIVSIVRVAIDRHASSRAGISSNALVDFEFYGSPSFTSRFQGDATLFHWKNVDGYNYLGSLLDATRWEKCDTPCKHKPLKIKLKFEGTVRRRISRLLEIHVARESHSRVSLEVWRNSALFAFFF